MPPGGDAGLRSEALTVSVSDHAATGPVLAQTTPHYPRVLTPRPCPTPLAQLPEDRDQASVVWGPTGLGGVREAPGISRTS